MIYSEGSIVGTYIIQIHDVSNQQILTHLMNWFGLLFYLIFNNSISITAFSHSVLDVGFHYAAV